MILIGLKEYLASPGNHPASVGQIPKWKHGTKRCVCKESEDEDMKTLAKGKTDLR